MQSVFLFALTLSLSLYIAIRLHIVVQPDTQGFHFRPPPRNSLQRVSGGTGSENPEYQVDISQNLLLDMHNAKLMNHLKLSKQAWPRFGALCTFQRAIISLACMDCCNLKLLHLALNNSLCSKI